jgi:hypothetical protein
MLKTVLGNATDTSICPTPVSWLVCMHTQSGGSTLSPAHGYQTPTQEYR